MPTLRKTTRKERRLDTNSTTISQQTAQVDVERSEDIFVRQVDDRALPALQVLAEQRLVLAREVAGPIFIP
jgi:hypothetical protein